MEYLKPVVLFVVSAFLFSGCYKKEGPKNIQKAAVEEVQPAKKTVKTKNEIPTNAIEAFYEAQFKCDPNADRFAKVDKAEALNTHVWTVISDFKIKELPPNPSIEHPHKRYLLHYVKRAVFLCGAAVDSPKSYKEMKEYEKDKDAYIDAIMLMYTRDDGVGEFSRLDYNGMREKGMMNWDEDGHSYLHYPIEAAEKPNCVSKLEDLLSGKTKIDVDKLCAHYRGTEYYDKFYAQTKADLERLMGYWKRAAQENEKN